MTATLDTIVDLDAVCAPADDLVGILRPEGEPEDD